MRARAYSDNILESPLKFCYCYSWVAVTSMLRYGPSVQHSAVTAYVEFERAPKSGNTCEQGERRRLSVGGEAKQ